MSTTSPYKVIRVTPTLDTSAYANNDVFFNPTEIPNAVNDKGGCSELTGITILNKDDADHDIDLIFMQVSRDLGTINDAVGSNSKWTNALAEQAKILGVIKIDMSDSVADLINNQVYTYNNFGSGTGGMTPILLQAESNSTSVYVAAVSRGGTPTCAADAYEFAFHVKQY